jgi:hypothetical protein
MTTEFFRKYSDIVMEAEAPLVDISQVAANLEFKPTHKLAKQYKQVASVENMPAMSYATAEKDMPVVTVTADGKETQNVAAPGDVVMSGPSREQYVVKAAKFPKLYQVTGNTAIPEQSPRMVAVYTGKDMVSFTAPWGESMILKHGDYLVKDGDAGYYRIAKAEYEQTYNPPGK